MALTGTLSTQAMPPLAARFAIIAGALLAFVGSVMLSAGVTEVDNGAVATSDHQAASDHQAQFFTQLHSAAALAQYCAHIGRVRKQKVSPCAPGAPHPCCTEKQLQVEKMQGSQPSSFNWADPTSWSGPKGNAAQHLAHKHFASIQGMSAPTGGAPAGPGWQSTQQEYAPAQAQAQGPPQQQMMPGYYPHLLPGQPGVPEAGMQAPQQYQQPYQQQYQQPEYQQQYQQPPQYQQQPPQYQQQPYQYQQQYQQPPQYQQSPMGQPAPQAYNPPQQPAYGAYVSPQQGPSGAQMSQAAPQAQPGQPAPQFQYPRI